MRDLLIDLKIITNTHLGRGFEKKVAIHNLGSDISCYTNFLDQSTPIKDRLYCIIHHITSKPSCHICKNQTKLYQYGFNKYCSTKCSNSDPSIIEKYKHTCLTKYGAENTLCKGTITRIKANETLIEKYGTDIPIYNEQIKNKQEQTNNERYGSLTPLQNPEILRKTKQTLFERHGVEVPIHNNQIKLKQEQTNIERYGYTSPLKNTDVRNKMVNTIQEKYGVFNIKQIRYSTNTTNKLQNGEWLLTQHHTLKRTITDIAKELEVDITTVLQYNQKHNITQRYGGSMGEREISAFLNYHNIIHTSNDREPIGPLELDIIIPQHNVAIEYCGLYWHSEQRGKDRNYHKNKHDLCNEKGIQLLTIFEDEWQQRRVQVENKIRSLCGVDDNERVFARKCTIISLNTTTKRDFFEQNHIQGDGPGSINYGLMYNNILVACMSFIKKSNNEYYLNRYATSHRVMGGFSKLLKHFENNNQWEQIISFADQRWSDGDLYYKTGFTLDKVIPPDYYYSGDGGKTRTHKFNYRRKNLPKLLNNFDPNKSECQNCDENGILRIWDCGKMRFVKNNKSRNVTT